MSYKECLVIGQKYGANSKENRKIMLSEKEKEGLISEEDDSSDDDWEGVEMSDLEKVFVVATEYGKLDDKLQGIKSDVQMRLYTLHKVATKGPCCEAQPMALKVSEGNELYKELVAKAREYEFGCGYGEVYSSSFGVGSWMDSRDSFFLIQASILSNMTM